jgi:hypothetical protein
MISKTAGTIEPPAASARGARPVHSRRKEAMMQPRAIAVRTPAKGAPTDRRCLVNAHTVKLAGNVSEIRPGLYWDKREQVTVSVQGAEPLYAELRVPNDVGWKLGQKIMVTITPADTDGGE